MQKVTACAWSPNNRRLAIVTADRDRVIQLYDENGTKRDKFATKGMEKGAKNYLVKGLAFSPDSTKLAVAQSDNIVYVYKLGLEWGDKKSICNKFPQSTPLTACCWPRNHPGKVCFGLAGGKVKIGQIKNNKAATLYNGQSCVVSMASSPDGFGLCTGHLDGSIYTFFFEDASTGGGPAHRKLCTHSSPPYALSWGESVLAAGLDSRITFYSAQDGSTQRTFDYRDDDTVKGFTCASFNPSGETGKFLGLDLSIAIFSVFVCILFYFVY
jgi:intraflagellar transport protein 172